MKKTFSRKRYTEAELATIKSLINKGVRVSEIARAVGRTSSAIAMVKLKMKYPDRYSAIVPLVAVPSEVPTTTTAVTEPATIMQELVAAVLTSKAGTRTEKLALLSKLI